MENRIDLSIIILNYNTCDLLKQCLTSIEKTKKDKLAVEVLVVDNYSEDASCEMVKKEFPLVRLLENTKNVGFAAGNNMAIPYSTGRYVLFLNSDTIIPDEIFPELIDFLDQNQKVGALTVKLVLRTGDIDPDCHRGFPSPWASLTYLTGLEKIFPKSRLFGQYHQSFLPLNQVHEIDSACGAFLVFRREALDEIKGFDESYFFYGEDIDLCFRLKEKGWKLIYYPKIEVIHYKGASSGLRRETEDIVKADRKTRLKSAKASIQAMKIFYNKFYKDKYPPILTAIVLAGIQFKGWLRYLSHILKS